MEKELEELSIQFDEGMAVYFTEEELKEANKEYENSLVIKLAGDRGYNKNALKNMLRSVWRPSGNLKFTEVEGKLLVAKFGMREDVDKILEKGPWNFMGRAVQIGRWIQGKSLSEMIESKLKIWVQVHNLPIELRDEMRASRFAEKVGKVIRIWEGHKSNNKGDEVRKFVKFLVEIDVSKPVVPVAWWMNPVTQTPIRIDFKYERLPNICFRCGSFHHDTSQCLKQASNVGNSVFGPWLRADFCDSDENIAGRWIGTPSREEQGNEVCDSDEHIAGRWIGTPSTEEQRNEENEPSQRETEERRGQQAFNPMNEGDNNDSVSNQKLAAFGIPEKDLINAPIFEDFWTPHGGKIATAKAGMSSNGSRLTQNEACPGQKKEKEVRNPLKHSPSNKEMSVGWKGPIRMDNGPISDLTEIPLILLGGSKRKSSKEIDGFYKRKKQCSSTGERTAAVSLRGNSKRVEWRSEQVKVRNEPRAESTTLGSSM